MTLRTHLIALTVLLAALLNTGCTQNDGDITPWFGYWRLQSIAVDGEPDTTRQPDEVTIAFQTTVMKITWLDGLATHDRQDRFAEWLQTGPDALEIDFTGWQAGVSEYTFKPWAWLHMPDEEPFAVKVTWIEGHSRCTWTFTSPDGHTITYTLQKV